jgi:hypothetical protein
VENCGVSLDGGGGSPVSNVAAGAGNRDELARGGAATGEGGSVLMMEKQMKIVEMQMMMVKKQMVMVRKPKILMTQLSTTLRRRATRMEQ